MQNIKIIIENLLFLTHFFQFKNLFIFISVGILVLLISAINFINITMATATRRYKEIGVSKVLGALKSHRAGEPAVLSALKDLKDLHRNPLIHPEHTLEDVDEAIALLGSIHAVVVRMLKAIPLPATPAQAAPAAP